MRVTNGMVINNMMRNLGNNFGRMDKLQQQMATGKKFLTPSDDPIGVSRSLRLNTEYSNMSQYKRNVDDATSWLDTTEIATNNMMSVLQRARELTVQANNGTNSIDEKKKIADEIEQLKQELISIGNSSYAGSYIFSGFKTDKPLLKSDGTYDIGGGTLNSNESIQYNVGMNEKLAINFVGQRIFGYLDSTLKEQHEIETDEKFSGTTVTVGSNDQFTINYEGKSYTINLTSSKTYNASELTDFVNDINAAINATTFPDSNIKNKVKAEIVEGKMKFVSAKPISVSESGTNKVLSEGAKMSSGSTSTLKYVDNIDDSNLDGVISMGSNDNILKSGADFPGLTVASTVASPANSFVLNYNGKQYTIKMDDKTYTADDEEVFCLDVNNKIKSMSELSGHIEFKAEDGRLNIISDKAMSITDAPAAANKIGGTGVTGMGFSSGDKTVTAKYILESSVIDLKSNSITVPSSPDNNLAINYNGTTKYISLTPKTYDGTPGSSLSDFVNDIQNGLKAAGFGDHVTVHNEDGRITFYSDKSMKTLYSAEGANFGGTVTVDSAHNTFTVNYMGNDYNIVLQNNAGYTMSQLKDEIQRQIDANSALKGHVSVDINTSPSDHLSFNSDEKITIKNASANALNVTSFGMTNGQDSNTAITDGVQIRTGKGAIKLNEKVESGTSTQLISVFDKLIEDLNSNNIDGISRGLKRLDAQVANLSSVRAEIGVKTNRLELTSNRITDDTINLKSLLSKNEDADMSEVIMQLKMEENVYQASLSAGARIIQPSLVDFLR